MDNGWIKLHRKLLDNPITQRPKYAWLWIVLLLLANHEDKEFIWNGKKQIIKRGQILTGRKQLSMLTGIKSTTIERILDYLEKDGQIGQQKTNKFRLILVKKYNKYQEVGQQTDNKRTTNGQQTDTNKNVKNDKNTLPKGNEGKALTFGNPLINSFISLLKEYNQSVNLDGTQRSNRYAAKRVIEKIRKEFIARTKREPTDDEILTSMRVILASANDFHQKNLTNYNYVDKNFYKIIKSSKRGIVKI